MKLFQTHIKRDDLSCLDYSSTVSINNSLILLPIYHLILMSFCTQSLPGVAESTLSKSEGKPSPWREGARVRADEGWRKRALPRPSPTICDRPSSPGGRELFLMIDSATSPFGSAQNDSIAGDV